jgi:hypothetical protein
VDANYQKEEEKKKPLIYEKVPQTLFFLSINLQGLEGKVL